jgi:hypothetical protein
MVAQRGEVSSDQRSVQRVDAPSLLPAAPQLGAANVNETLHPGPSFDLRGAASSRTRASTSAGASTTEATTRSGLA